MLSLPLRQGQRALLSRGASPILRRTMRNLSLSALPRLPAPPSVLRTNKLLFPRVFVEQEVKYAISESARSLAEEASITMFLLCGAGLFLTAMHTLADLDSDAIAQAVLGNPEERAQTLDRELDIDESVNLPPQLQTLLIPFGQTLLTALQPKHLLMMMCDGHIDQAALELYRETGDLSEIEALHPSDKTGIQPEVKAMVPSSFAAATIDRYVFGPISLGARAGMSSSKKDAALSTLAKVEKQFGVKLAQDPSRFFVRLHGGALTNVVRNGLFCQPLVLNKIREILDASSSGEDLSETQKRLLTGLIAGLVNTVPLPIDNLEIKKSLNGSLHKEARINLKNLTPTMRYLSQRRNIITSSFCQPDAQARYNYSAAMKRAFVSDLSHMYRGWGLLVGREVTSLALYATLWPHLAELTGNDKVAKVAMMNVSFAVGSLFEFPRYQRVMRNKTLGDLFSGMSRDLRREAIKVAGGDLSAVKAITKPQLLKEFVKRAFSAGLVPRQIAATKVGLVACLYKEVDKYFKEQFDVDVSEAEFAAEVRRQENTPERPAASRMAP